MARVRSSTRRRKPLRAAPRPMVVAHRGASSIVAEHTLAAYISAIEAGADALECDVRLTRDGHLVCVHDRTVNRTSDGRGAVSEWDLEGLHELDFSSWHEPHTSSPAPADRADSPYLTGVAPDRIDESGGVLTLDRLLELVHDTARPVRLLIETKHPTRYGGLVEKELVNSIARFGWAGTPPASPSLRHDPVMDNRVIIMSFAPTALRRVKLQAPDVPTVLLLDRLLPTRRDGVLPAGVPIAGPGLHLLRADPGFAARAHARGNQVYTWTVDEPGDIEFVRTLGVDTIITNCPERVLQTIDAP